MPDRAMARPLWPGFVLIVAACVALVGLEVYSGFAQAPELERNREQVDHAFAVIGAAQALELAIQDAERGQRGYLLTGDAAYLEPYTTGAAQAPVLLAKLEQLTTNQPEQQHRLLDLEKVIDTKLNELKRTIEIRQSQGAEQALQVVRTDVGLTAMRTINRTLDAVIAAENENLAKRLDQSTVSERAARATSVGAGVIGLAIMAMGVLVAWRGTSAIRHAERQRSESERHLRLLIDGVTDYAIYMIDPQGRVASWNGGAQRIKGYTRDEIVGKHFSTFYTEEDRKAGVPAHALETAAREGRYEAEGWRVRKNGERFTASVVLDAIREPSGKLIGFAKITRDVTERVQQREALDRTRAALAQSQKMDALGQLTGGVAHDFNNLLQVIRSGIEMIQRRVKSGDPGLLAPLDLVAQSVERAASLTQRLLAFTRRQPLNPSPIDVNRLVSGMSDMLRRTLGEGIAIETVLAGGLWPVSADASQLESAIVNLAVNARDAMPGGGKLTIETANLYLDETYAAANSEVMPGQYVMIAVSDTGTGMPPEVAARAVEPFFTTKDVGQGTGLGLSQVYGFIKQSGGHVKIYTEPGAGTTVKLYLARLVANVVPDAAPPAAAAPIGTGSETILLVEDESGVRELTAAMLRELGYRVLVAPNGASALRLLEKEDRIDLLFTDVGLPDGLNGRQLVDKATRLKPTLRVLFMTGYARNAIVHQGRLDPGVELIVKPFTQRDVADRIRRVLDTKAA